MKYFPTRRNFLTGSTALLASAACLRADAKFHIVAEGLLAPESPKAMPDGSVLVVEMARGTLSRCRPNGKVEVVADLGASPNGCAIGPDGAAYIAQSGGLKFRREGDLLIFAGAGDPPRIPSIQKVDLKTGAHSNLYLECDGKPLPGTNDLVFDRHGGFFFSGGNAVHYAKADGSTIRRLADCPASNGIVLSPDHKRLFVCARNQVVVYDVSGEGRLAAGPDGKAQSRVFGQIKDGQFDSMAAQGDGGLAVGTLNVGAITDFAPDGSVRATVSLAPEKFVTSVAFGGKGHKIAYATLTQTGKLAAVEWPRAGLRLANQ